MAGQWGKGRFCWGGWALGSRKISRGIAGQWGERKIDDMRG